MLLSEELALIAIDPDTGRHALGMRDALNACMAGLLLVELVLPDADVAASPVLTAAQQVVAEKRGKPKAALSHMSRGLQARLGTGTWDSAVAGLERAGVVAPSEGAIRPSHELIDPAARDAIVVRLQTAAAGDDPLDVRTAALLSMTGPAHLLELVAPDRKTRAHARRRIDHCLDETELAEVGGAVRKVLADAQAAVIAATTAASIAAVTSS